MPGLAPLHRGVFMPGLLAALLAAVAGCASQPPTAPAPGTEAPPPAVSSVTPPPAMATAPEAQATPAATPSPAVVALLSEARSQGRQGEWDRAAASLERALRIEPRNPRLWHELGQVRLAQNRPEQAEAMATKSNGLAGRDNELRQANWRLIAAARRLRGDEAGARAALGQAAALGQE